MERTRLDHHQATYNLAIPDGWALLEHFNASELTILEFQRGGRFGPRVTAVGVTFDAALAYGRDRMLMYDERDRQRQGVRHGDH